jgi:hypothetical protein
MSHVTMLGWTYAALETAPSSHNSQCGISVKGFFALQAVWHLTFLISNVFPSPSPKRSVSFVTKASFLAARHSLWW